MSNSNHSYKAKKATFYGAGVGPGDPLLLTIKTHQLIQTADVISYLASTDGHSQARDIARHSLASRTSDAEEVVVTMPMSTDRSQANCAYDAAAQQLQKHLQAGKSVVFLCEGDPLFFGSFSYLLQRLSDDFSCQVVPGIASVNAASAALQQPLTLLQESFAVVSGRHTDQQIENTLQQHDSVVIMKAGLARPRILALLRKTGRWADGHYLEYIGRDNQRLVANLDELEDQTGPYFSLFVILRGERPA
ncbi:MAG: precorrin-2 C(20)-methyltransferase [Gammaproteobacteria bacterium]|jgi:precorrin-2/cobalt-factor-2 C20-methyltransferase|nr:precorrin-2 C(20)-methyltransferase [Gammaproteobacteria bacterium]